MMKISINKLHVICEVGVIASFAAFCYVLKILEPYYKGGKAFDADGTKMLLLLCTVFAVGAAFYIKEFHLIISETEDILDEEIDS